MTRRPRYVWNNRRHPRKGRGVPGGPPPTAALSIATLPQEPRVGDILSITLNVAPDSIFVLMNGGEPMEPEGSGTAYSFLLTTTGSVAITAARENYLPGSTSVVVLPGLLLTEIDPGVPFVGDTLTISFSSAPDSVAATLDGNPVTLSGTGATRTLLLTGPGELVIVPEKEGYTATSVTVEVAEHVLIANVTPGVPSVGQVVTITLNEEPDTITVSLNGSTPVAPSGSGTVYTFTASEAGEMEIVATKAGYADAVETIAVIAAGSWLISNIEPGSFVIQSMPPQPNTPSVSNQSYYSADIDVGTEAVPEVFTVVMIPVEDYDADNPENSVVTASLTVSAPTLPMTVTGFADDTEYVLLRGGAPAPVVTLEAREFLDDFSDVGAVGGNLAGRVATKGGSWASPPISGAFATSNSGGVQSAYASSVTGGAAIFANWDAGDMADVECRMRVRMRNVSTTGPLAMFCRSEPDGVDRIQITANFVSTADGDTIRVAEVVDGVSYSLGSPYPIPNFLNNVDYDIRATVIGNEVRVYLDGSLVITTPTTVLAAGKCGIRQASNAATGGAGGHWPLVSFKEVL